MLKTSVILACYNGSCYIEKQLDSIRNQSSVPDEVIILDDQSTDDTFEIVKDYLSKYKLCWKLYRQKANVGYIKNFATGIRKSTGDILLLSDQDDIWRKEKIEKIREIFDKNEDILCINSSFVFINKNDDEIQIDDRDNNYGMLFHDVKKGCLSKIVFEDILYRNISMGCTMAFRNKIANKYLSSSKLKAPHDWEINMIASIDDGLYFYNDKLIDYRIHDSNTTGNDIFHNRKNTRMQNSIVMLDFIKSARVYNKRNNQEVIYRNVLNIVETRYNFLKYGGIMKWFFLLHHVKSYRKIVSFKGMLMDFIYRYI